MHKLKNKHTGEVITTPYLAEVEEYLKSGDYEMSENKYPYIGGSKLTGCDYVVYSDDCFYNLDSRNFYKSINQENLKNIAREYLMNTYGKCESQEHVDFICKLAENHGFELNEDYTYGKYFYISATKYGFSDNEFFARDGARLIRLPLPQKEKEMPEVKPAIATISPKDNNPNNKAFDVFEVKETANAFEGVRCSGEAFHCYKDYWGIEFKKPVYTKEMHERGVLPPVGSIISAMTPSPDRVKGEVLKVRNNGSFDVVAVMSLGKNKDVRTNELFYCALSDIKPITTIEDELTDDIAEYFDSSKKHCKALVSELFSKYNITPKEEQ